LALAHLGNPTERIFTGDEWGDYLIYQLFPKGTKVYIDGRSDFYGEKFCQEYIDLVTVKYDWEKILARHGVEVVLLPPDAPLASTLKESKHWRVTYDDGSAIIFRASNRAPVEQVSAAYNGGMGRDPITQYKDVIFEITHLKGKE